MRLLVIGGNGFIGTPLVRELCDSGHEVAVFHRRPDAIGATLQIQGDRNSLIQHRDQIARFAPHGVIDLILSSGRQAAQLTQALEGIAHRVVVVSSMDVYRAWGVIHGVEPGPLEPLPITEDSPLRTTRQLYPPETVKRMAALFSWLDDDYDKIAVEETVMGQRQVPGTVLRLPMVYGPGDPLHRVFPLLKRIADQRPFVLLPDGLAAWRGPRGYVENVAHAIALAATSDRALGRTYNVCEEPTLSELEWQQKIARQIGWTGKFVVLLREQAPKHLLLPGNAAQHVVVSSARIRSELGYQEIVGTSMAIQRTVSWEQQNPPASADPQQFDYSAEDQAYARATKVI